MSDFPILPDEQYVKNPEDKKKQSSVFIGCSREAEKIAELVKKCFHPDEFDVDIWNEGIFGKTRTTGGTISNAEWLKNFTDIYDFAIFLFVPDDEIISQTRKENESFIKGKATRHNVIFEFGWFLGRIGAKRSYVLVDKSFDSFFTKFFTDLSENINDSEEVNPNTGAFRLEIYQFESNFKEIYQPRINQDLSNFDAKKLNVAVEKIIQRMRTVEEEVEVGFLPSTSLALGYFNNFLRPVIEAIDFIGQETLPDWLDKKIDNDELRNFVKTLRKNKRSVIFKIVLSELKDTRIQSTDKYYESSFFVNQLIPTEGRPKTIHCKASSLKNYEEDIVIYDIPTTISTSLDSINFVTPHKDIKDLLSTKEQFNFQKALKTVVHQHNQQQSNDTFKDTIEFIDFDRFLAETGQI